MSESALNIFQLKCQKICSFTTQETGMKFSTWVWLTWGLLHLINQESPAWLEMPIQPIMDILRHRDWLKCRVFTVDQGKDFNDLRMSLSSWIKKGEVGLEGGWKVKIRWKSEVSLSYFEVLWSSGLCCVTAADPCLCSLQCCCFSFLTLHAATPMFGRFRNSIQDALTLLCRAAQPPAAVPDTNPTALQGCHRWEQVPPLLWVLPSQWLPPKPKQ